MDDELKDVDVTIDDLDETESEKKEEAQDWWESVVDWIANHKLICCLSVIGIPIILIWFGAKLFSSTETVEIEKLPDPTIMDKFDKIPVSEISHTTYEYVLKDEYRNE